MVRRDGPSLLGRDWLQNIRLNWHAICHVDKGIPSLKDVLQRHAVVFSEKMGVARNMVAKIHVDPQATPKFYRPWSVPYVIKGKIEQELKRLENEGVVSKVVESEWAAPHSTCDEGRWSSQIMRGLQSHHKSGHQGRFLPTASH